MFFSRFAIVSMFFPFNFHSKWDGNKYMSEKYEWLNLYAFNIYQQQTPHHFCCYRNIWLLVLFTPLFASHSCKVIYLHLHISHCIPSSCFYVAPHLSSSCHSVEPLFPHTTDNALQHLASATVCVFSSNSDKKNYSKCYWCFLLEKIQTFFYRR